ncbi:hypothetical protein GBAR_LOCUS12448 [Geodia barretti]|uniref:Uncharacterized protein n=2 Tax=Geodia barretti TaxID=519541 RepID=A0AA35S292_GEOBA|nr:hypothetical protein GBAR_LOCUS12448 [Geodia barretti]
MCADFDFLSPAQRSCINLGKTEPCVRKAVQVLKRLKNQLQHNMGYGEVERTFLSADRPSKPMHLEGLCIEGRATGSQRSYEDDMRSDLDWNGVIKGVLDLVLRMETDRQGTLNRLSEEKEKVHYLSQKLDVEAKRRLCSLESAVQSDSKHSQMKKEEAELTHNSSLLEEKISDEKQKIDHIKQLYKETSEKVVLAKKALMEVEDKLLLSQKKEDAEGRERARKLGSARRRIQTARDEVKDAEERNEMLQTKVLRFQRDIEEANKKELECEACASKNISDFKGIHTEV